MFHFQISGKLDNEEHPSKRKLILTTLLVFHFEISGNFFNELHLENNPPIIYCFFSLIKLSTSLNDIGVKELYLEYIPPI